MRKLSTDVAEKILQDAGFIPLEPYRSVNVPWRAKCVRCGHESSPRLYSIRAGRRCPPCGRAAASSRMRVSPSVATAEMEAAGLSPLEEYPGADHPWRCRCLVCGAEVRPRLAGVRKGRGCGACSITAPRNPAAAAEVMRKADLEPLEPYGSHSKPWRCRCLKCGREVTPRYSNVAKGNSGCRHCAGHAWDVFYVVLNELENHLKFGITSGDPRPRLGFHAQHGFTTVTRLLVGLRNARSLESDVKATLQLAGEKPVRGKEYFHVRVLATVLDVVDHYPGGPAIPSQGRVSRAPIQVVAGHSFPRMSGGNRL